MTALREPGPLQARLAAARRAHAEPSPGLPRWTGAAPLSPAQARLWFMAQLEPGSSAYNAPALLRLRGRLDDAAMLAALRDLAERHPVLRSVVEDREGGPVAVPVAPDAVPVRAAAVAAGALEEAVRAETERPFALDAEPPMRAALFRLPGGDEHVLALTLHHIATDAWSGNLLLADLAALYAARLGLGEAPAAPAVQYADYAAWLAEGHEAARTAAAVEWWGQRLAGLAPALDLPVDRPRRPGADASAARVAVDLPESLTARVRAVAAERRCTPFVVLLAAWQELLGRVCATDDVPVAVPESGRHRAETEAAVGCFINTLVIRTDTSGDPTGRELIDRVRDGVLDSFAHAAAPFEQVVARVNPERSAGASPLAQVQLNVYDAPADPRFAGLATELSEAPAETAKYDLSLTLVDAGATFAGGLVYKRALFDARTAERLAQWYRHVLEGMLAGLDRPVGAVPLEPNPAPLLAGPARRWPDERSVRALIEAQADARPDATAVIAPDGVLTYAELERRANRIAHRLRAAGVIPDQPVGVLLEPSTALACALLGILKAGGGYLPMDATYPAGRIAGILETAGARTLLTTAELADRGAGRTVIALDDPASLAGRPSDRPEPVAGPDHLAHVIFTSGSTGAPKGVAQTNRSVANYLHGVLERLGDVAGGSFAMVSTPAADFGLTPIYGALTTGGCLHLVDREIATDPAAFARYLAEHPLDVLKCVPSHLELLATHGELADVLPRRLLILAGEACPWSLVERVHAARPGLRVQNHYGHTESTMISLVCETGELPAGQRDGVVPLGTPLANVTGYIVDRAGRPLPAGVPGELIVTGPGVARGYVGRPDLTAERFVPDPVSGVRGYRSGDRIRVRLDGAVEFLGRVDDQVKIRGYRVEPGEVVAALRALPGIREAVVLAVGEGRERKLAAWLVGDELDVAAVRARLREQLPDYMVPASFVLLDRLPLTPNGKIDRAALPAPTSERAADRRAPSTPAEARVAAAWGEVLGVEDVGADDDFFALGGDSFAAVRAVRAIDPALRVIDLFTHPTVQQLGAFLDARDGGAGGGLLHRLGGPATAVATLIGVPYGGGSAAAFQPLAAPLAERGIALLAAELPGHDPARPDEAPLGLAELVDRLAEEVAETVSGPVAVYGHCVGSAVATALARRLEADGRIVLGAIAGGSFPAAPLPGRLSALASRVFGERWVSDRLYRDALVASGGVTDDMDEAATTVALRAMRHDAHAAQEWFGAQLEGDGLKLRAPLLCLVGERDSQTELYAERYREWGAFAERVELAAIPRAGHYFLRHQGAEVAELLAGTLEDWAAGRLPAPVRDVPVERGGLRRFYTVAAGQLVSNVGSALTAFALGVWAYQRSGRIVDLALVVMLAQLPAVLATPLGGALADRLDRRRIMLACDAVSGLAMAALVVLLATDRLALWSVLGVVGVTSLVTAVQQPAWLAAIAQLAPKPYLPQANALANLGRSFGNIVAPLAGGVLVATLGLSAVVAIDVASFGVGLVTLLAVRFPDRLFRPRVESFRSSVSGGWRFIKRRRPLVVMVVFVAAANYFNAVLWVAVTPLVLSFAGPAGLGVVTAIGGAGAALGGVAVLVWGGTRRRATGMVGFVVGSGAGTILMGLWPSVAVVAIGLAVRWGSMAISNAHWLSLIQVKVGPELQGRVLATNLMLVTVMEPLGFLTASPLADLLGVSALVLASGAFLTVWGLLGLRYRPLRYMEDALPDAVLGTEIDDDLDRVQARVDLAWAT